MVDLHYESKKKKTININTLQSPTSQPIVCPYTSQLGRLDSARSVQAQE